MWWIKRDSKAEDRGGFQNRDVGRSNLDNDFGPNFGVDYARFSDPPDILRDQTLKKLILSELQKTYPDIPLDVKVRNGFVIVKGQGLHANDKSLVLDAIYSVEGVREIISDFSQDVEVDGEEDLFTDHLNNKENRNKLRSDSSHI